VDDGTRVAGDRGWSFLSGAVGDAVSGLSVPGSVPGVAAKRWTAVTAWLCVAAATALIKGSFDDASRGRYVTDGSGIKPVEPMHPKPQAGAVTDSHQQRVR
jgi:hypothetical protein